MTSCKSVSSFNKRDVFKEHSRIRLATIYTFIHLHILSKRKYVSIVIPTWAPYKPLEVGKKKSRTSMSWWGSKNIKYNEWFESTTRGEGKLCFVFKILRYFSNWLEWRKMVIYFKLFHSSTAQSFMVDTLNSAVHAWLGMVLCWYLVPRLS